MVIIDRDLWVRLDASAGFGNLNLTAQNANFTTASIKHGINCPGNIYVNLLNTIVHEDLIVAVSENPVATYTVILVSVTVMGTKSITPPGKGTISDT